MFKIETYFDEDDNMYHLDFNGPANKKHKLKLTTFADNKDDPYYATDGMGCTMRALGHALNMGYNDIYDLMHEEARYQRLLPHKTDVIHNILRANGFKCEKYTADDYYHFFDLVHDYRLDTAVGPFVVLIPGHCFCIENGIIYENILNYNEDPLGDMIRFTIARLMDPNQGVVEAIYYHTGDYFA